jgi:riboflavin biosynthesis pyrimidine reductase
VFAAADAPADRRAELAKHAAVVATDGLPSTVRALRERGLGRILCEGGPSLFAGLVADGLLDELCLTLSPMLAGPGPGRIVAGRNHPPARLALTALLEEDGALFHRYALRRAD